jgi:predicted AAA+ superfamily ATPase
MGYRHRNLETRLQKYQQIFPVVAILGPRQCGKSTLIKHVLSGSPEVVFLDLQKEEDLNKVQDPVLFFRMNEHKTICLDEIQLKPDLFRVMRSLIDEDRRPNRFILSGSASLKLIQQSSESLAGRIGYLSLTPFEFDELPEMEIPNYWNRGGFPDSVLAENDEYSYIWRENFIRTYVERDIPQLGYSISSMQFRRFIRLCAHYHGQVLNYNKMASAMELSNSTIRRFLDLLEQTFLIRTLPPFETNSKKRLIKSPKLYLRDAGLLHYLLGIPTMNELLANPALGASWEGLAIEQILTVAEGVFEAGFYRTSHGVETDLVLNTPKGLILVECKASTAPALTRGFYTSIQDLKPQQAYLLAPISGPSYPLNNTITITGIREFISLLKESFP